ncbi:hypothetical protein OESDEN_02953 [Oesophagostomum dentatum]|uniref:Uncharacterized protein n=1 Tax=Oesophagostomum dentatum TaxID=61180 RepID=A0A0B1TMN3_OESDE|nr:hypothetical protein OESDEN_02953 [Oesophagostomum dentatum]
METYTASVVTVLVNSFAFACARPWWCDDYLVCGPF